MNKTSTSENMYSNDMKRRNSIFSAMDVDPVHTHAHTTCPYPTAVIMEGVGGAYVYHMLP